MLQLTGVSKTYGLGVHALDPTDLSVQPGQVTVLLGPSGAGKSTLLRCMNLLVKPTTGTVRADGLPELDSRRALRRHRRQTGMVFQHHQLLLRFTALRNVLLGRVGYHGLLRGLWPAGRAEERIVRRCRRVHAMLLAHASLQKHRLACARASTQRRGGEPRGEGARGGRGWPTSAADAPPPSGRRGTG